MTKRDFDRATKHDHGFPMASDERRSYRAERLRVERRDLVEERAGFMAWRNHRSFVNRDGYLPTLGPGSRYRGLAMRRAAAGVALLG